MDRIPPVVEVIWVDSVILDDGLWMNVSDATDMLRDPNALVHRTVGFLVTKSTDAIVVANSINVDQKDQPSDRMCGAVVIPKVAIKEQQEIIPGREL